MIEISFCGPNDIERLVRFIGTQWKSDHIFVREPDFLRWHYGHHDQLKLPDKGLSILLAHDGDQIVGMLGLNEIGFCLDGRLGNCIWTSIWYADPQYRRQAVGMRLWKSALDLGADAVCMVGMNAAVKPFFEHLEFEFLDDLPRYGVVLCSDAMAGLLGDPSLRDSLDEFAAPKGTSLDPAVQLFDSDHHANWDRFLKIHMSRGFAGAVKDSHYLTWRYRYHPIFEYQTLTYVDASNAHEALVVYRIENVLNQDVTVMRIVELIGSNRGQLALLGHSLAIAKQLGCAYSDMNVVNKKQRAMVERSQMSHISLQHPVGKLIPHRFQPVDSPARPLISAFWLNSAFRQDAQQLTDHPGFYFSRADGDQDRPS